jgi:hypothetical protein
MDTLLAHFYVSKIICNRPRTFDSVPQSLIRRIRACIDSGGEHFDDLLWTVNFIANKNSAVIKLETYIVNVLSVTIKFCIARLLMVECHLPVQLNHSFPYTCWFVLTLFMGRTLEVCPSTLGTPCVYACDTPVSERSWFPYKMDNSWHTSHAHLSAAKKPVPFFTQILNKTNYVITDVSFAL